MIYIYQWIKFQAKKNWEKKNNSYAFFFENIFLKIQKRKKIIR